MVGRVGKFITVLVYVYLYLFIPHGSCFNAHWLARLPSSASKSAGALYSRTGGSQHDAIEAAVVEASRLRREVEELEGELLGSRGVPSNKAAGAIVCKDIRDSVWRLVFNVESSGFRYDSSPVYLKFKNVSEGPAQRR